MIPCEPALRQRLIAVAQQVAAPGLVIRGPEVWNAFTRAFRRAFADFGFPHSDPKQTLLSLTGDRLPEEVVFASEPAWTR